MDAIKLDETITEMEQQVKRIKSITEMYQDIKSLADQLSIIKNQTEKHTQEIDSLKKGIENSSVHLSNLITETMNAHDGMTKDHQLFEKNYLDYLQTLNTENKRLYLDLESLLSSKIDRIKSDLSVEVREGAFQTQRVLENYLAGKLSLIENDIKDLNADHEKHSKRLTIIMVILFVAVVVDIISKFIK